MSLLEDIYLQDEADEAQELERVIEGDEYDERPRPSSPNSDENSEKEDEAEEDKRRVDPTKAKEKRVVKNPRLVLNPARLTGPRGIQIIPDHFKDFKFKGKGHEKEDLDLVLKRLEHWAYRLFPKFQFEDCLKKIETLGKKRPVMVHLHKIRTDQYTTEETVVQRDSSDDEDQGQPVAQEEDEFDKLLQQQIELARATPAPNSAKKTFETPRTDNRSLLMPKATSSPSISDEQKERMLRNRKLAEERRLAKLKQNSNDSIATNLENSTVNNESIIVSGNIDAPNISTDDIARKNRSNVIDSSDDECDMTSVNQSITIDVHHRSKNDEQANDTEKALVETFVGNQSNKSLISSEIESNKGELNDGMDIQIESVDIANTRKSPVKSSIEEKDDLNSSHDKTPENDSIENNDTEIDAVNTDQSTSNEKTVQPSKSSNDIEQISTAVGEEFEDMDIDFSEEF